MLFGIRGKYRVQSSIKIQYVSLLQIKNPALCHHFRIPSLQHCIQVANLIFLHKCVHSHLDLSYLVGNIQYNCPSRSLRSYTPFRISNSIINIKKYSVLNICMTTFNTLYLTEPTCDIFIGANTFRSVIQKHLYS